MTDRRRSLGAMLGMGAGRTTTPSSGRDPGAMEASTGHRLRRLVTPAVLVVAVALAVSIVAVPVRSHMSRNADINAAEELLTDLVASNADNAARLAALHTDDEVEHLARRDFGLAKPGEEIYHVLPPAVDPPRVPDGWPFNHLGLRLALE